MGFLSLLIVASMPVLQLLLVGSLGAFLASGYSNLLSDGIRRDLNKIVFAVFTPSLIFSSLAKTVTLQELISWWFMPVNIAITFLIGGALGWLAVKILRPPRHLEGLVVASCSAGNLGNLMLMIIPAVCGEPGNPFGGESSCSLRGTSYVSLSMALGGIFIWTHTYSLMKKDGERYRKLKQEGLPEISASAAADENSAAGETHDSESEEDSSDKEAQLIPSTKSVDGYSDQMILKPLLSDEKLSSSSVSFMKKIVGVVHQTVEELMEPPNIAAMVGFVVGAIPWLKSLMIGESAPLRVIEDSIKMLGDGTLPCTTLILGGNLTNGLRKSAVGPSLVIAVGLVRYIALPISGIAVVKAADAIGFLPQDALFRYVLLTQFTLPPAVGIGILLISIICLLNSMLLLLLGLFMI
ncbi:protein PIN-LIKES 7-like [Phalaenopsis equestris]|uniref:protein PIN-LIKES 7-like n=1 Tax=Phalaenopsis equestris TaxID=78828 RepID=UPI0009E251E4|nr:protein PIN-LIKES 7-like [Phalaenopsis equestris]